ncbi:MAG: hypothetical protein N2C14_33725, partial [Planctomycetales bacterium]
PELYREYQRLGVQVILQAWHDGGLKRREFRRSGRTLGKVIRATVQGHAVCNHLWICASNTSQSRSCFGAFAVRPNGAIVSRSKRDRPGVLTVDIDPDLPTEDPAATWRRRAMGGLLHSGTAVEDPRSIDRTCLGDPFARD